MRTTGSGRAAALLVIAALSLAGCGGSSTTTSTSTSAPTGSGAPGGHAKTGGALVVVRTGGIAGVADMVSIAADGTASVTDKTRHSRACTPSAPALDRLRAIDLSAVGATPSKTSQMADGFNYSVTSDKTTATASEGDDDSRRADLVDAAAAVVATCLAKRS